MKPIAILLTSLLLAGCVSATPGSRPYICVSLVSIQLGGSSAKIDTTNYMNGTNITQRHSLPIDAEISDPTTVSPNLTK